jgi:hypothetical protein
MAQVRLNGRGFTAVHDVLNLFRDKTVHDVLSPDIYQLSAERIKAPHASSYLGSRFSRNAAMPSRTSLVRVVRIWLRSSMAIAASSEGASTE